MKQAIYINRILNETYTLVGVKDLAHAWRLGKFACERMGWNEMDLVRVKIVNL
jgi:hypothetical protein